MRKKIVVPIVYFIVIATYVAISLLSIVPKTTNNWIGFGFAIFAMLLSMIIVLESDDTKSSSFPLSISVCVFSIIYTGVTVACDLLFGGKDVNGELLVKTRTFIVYEVICLAIFLVICIVLFGIKSHVKESNDKTNNEISKLNNVLNRVNLASNKASQLNNSKELMKNFELLVEEIKFSNFSIDSETEKTDFEIGSLLDRLDTDIENILVINSEDYTSVIDTILAIKAKIKERNVIINKKGSHI